MKPSYFAKVCAPVAAMLVAALIALACSSGGQPSPPPASSPDASPTPNAPSYSSLEPVQQAAIVDQTSLLAQQVADYNASLAELLYLVEADADESMIDDGKRTVAVRGLNVGLTADLLADAVARQDGDVAQDTATAYQNVAKAAYYTAYVVARADDLVDDPELTARALGNGWLLLASDEPDSQNTFSEALGPDFPANVASVSVPDTADAPTTTLSVSADLKTRTLDGLQGHVDPAFAGADTVRELADPLGGQSLDDVLSALATRLVLYAETVGDPASDGQLAYTIELAGQILVANAMAPGNGERVYHVLEGSDLTTKLYTFAKENLIPGGDDRDEIVHQVIAESVIDSVLGTGPDLTPLAGLLLSGSAAEERPTPPTEVAPPEYLEWDSLVDDMLSYVPLFTLSELEILEGDYPFLRFTIAYEDVAAPMKVWCFAGSSPRIQMLMPGSGEVGLVHEFAFDLLSSRPDLVGTRSETVHFACASPFGIFAEGTVTYPPSDRTPNQAAPTAAAGAEETPSPKLAGPTQLELYGYLFTSYSYFCRTGTVSEGLTNDMLLEFDLDAGTIYGGCHTVYPGVSPGGAARVDFDIAGTVTRNGEIDAEIVGTLVSVDSGYEYAVDWRFSGDFWGTVDPHAYKASGEYEITIEKFEGGNSINPEVEHLQWLARSTPSEE